MDAKLNPEAKVARPEGATGPGTSQGAFHVFGLARARTQLKTMGYFCELQHIGRFVAKDVVEGGRVPRLMRTLLDCGYLHGHCSTVRGGTVAETLRRVTRDRDQSVVRPAEKPLSATSGVVGLKGNPPPEGSTGEVAGMAGLQFTAPARGFDGEEARFRAVKTKKYREGEVLVIRCEGSRPGPRMREPLAYSAALCSARQMIELAHSCVMTRCSAPAEKACHASF